MPDLLERAAASDLLQGSLDEVEFTDEMIDAIAHRLIFMFGSPDAALEAIGN